MNVGMEWDREMTAQEVFKLAPDVAGLRTLTSLTRKVTYLEEAARSPKIARALDIRMFKSRNALRKWSDVELKFWGWSDGDVDRWSERDPSRPKGTHEGLMDRWHDALVTIRALQNTSLAGLEQTIRDKDLVIANLENQILKLMDQLDRANRRV